MPSERTITNGEKVAYSSNLLNSIDTFLKERRIVVRDDSFESKFLSDLGRIKSRLEVYFEYLDSFSISLVTGLPKYKIFRTMDRDEDGAEDELIEIDRQILEYMKKKGSNDSSCMPLREEYDDDRSFCNAYDKLVSKLIEMSIDDIYSKRFPEFQVDKLKRLKYLYGLKMGSSSIGNEKALDAKKFHSSSDIDFLIKMSGFDSQKEDSFISYGIGGAQRIDRGRSPKRNMPIIRRDGDYVISAQLDCVLDDLFSWSSSKVFENFSLLKEKKNVRGGDKILPRYVEFMRFGPFYYSGIILPLSVEEVIKDGIYGSEEEFKKKNPIDYCGCVIGGHIQEHSDEFALVLEGETTVMHKNDEIVTNCHIFVLVPEGSGLGDEIPSFIQGERNLKANVIYVDEYVPFEVIME